ncbi:hypothetical protein DESUT3_25710 [Desulfuromonas versatilis]|uniref:Uncharacterized protein n=1 Tax=Desulfuromonas versatilis TaxID=2802975 RepID=A0ABM8HXQ9_9BACT|nr:hypothetical protein [Desulfuromonas versatilis]BCR05502.1 hypothetical protein DESUT3_25710 [Desulfuromonas versatilis]
MGLATMNLDPQKIYRLRSAPVTPAVPGELRRVDQVFFVGADLPTRPTLETIFESDCQCPVDLFWFDFSDDEAYLGAEELVRQIKRNFRGFVLGRFETPPAHGLIDRAYAAGLDLLEIPAEGQMPSLAGEAALEHACSVFPRWSVVGSLAAHPRSLPRLDALAERGVVPMLSLDDTGGEASEADLHDAFQGLARCWRKYRVALKPLRPLIELATPLVTPPRPRGLGALLDKVDDARLRTASDLRRQLRVREVEASFESAGL